MDATSSSELPPDRQNNRPEAQEKVRFNLSEEANKQLKNDTVTPSFNDALRGREHSLVYIDDQSGGNRFEGTTHVRDVIAGNQYIFMNTETRAKIAGLVQTGEIDKVRKVYIAPASAEQAHHVLMEQHVLLLQGDQHTGKRTTALHLCSKFQAKAIYEGDPSTTDLSALEIEKDTGYVIDTFAPDSVLKLTSFVLNSLSRKLKDQQSYLVITLDARVPVAHESLDKYIVSCNAHDLPDNESLLKKHLAWYVTDKQRFAVSEALVQTEEVCAILANKLTPRQIDTLANLLKQVAFDELELEEALARFDVQAYHQVVQWFQEATNARERMFMVALAVLNGASYQAIMDAGRQLQAQVERSSTDSTTQHESVFDQTRSQRLKTVCAHLVRGYEQTEYGRSDVDLIQMDNAASQPAVLKHVWREFDDMRASLLTWLYNLGTGSVSDVRLRAAGAAGELSTYDFNFVLCDVLRPWAKASDTRTRLLAALALGVPIYNSDAAPQVLNLLHHWSTGKSLALRWTAAAAYGGDVGLRFPDKALRDLRSIATTIRFIEATIDDVDLFWIVLESLTNLFTYGPHVSVLSALRAWSDESRPSNVAPTALFVFTHLMDVVQVRTDTNDGNWPALLWLAREREVYRDSVTHLLRQALATSDTRRLAVEALRGWFAHIDHDQSLYRTLAQILFLLVAHGSPRDQERTINYLDLWAEESTAARKVRAVLRQHLKV